MKVAFYVALAQSVRYSFCMSNNTAIKKIFASARNAAKRGTVEQMRIKKIQMKSTVEMFTSVKCKTAECSLAAYQIATEAMEILMDLNDALAATSPANVVQASFR